MFELVVRIARNQHFEASRAHARNYNRVAPSLSGQICNIKTHAREDSQGTSILADSTQDTQNGIFLNHVGLDSRLIYGLKVSKSCREHLEQKASLQTRHCDTAFKFAIGFKVDCT